MKCPKCKEEIKDGQIRCEHCKTRIGSICKVCGSYNLINKKVCENCGNELLKSCPACKSINLPTASKCRKCGYVFEQNKTTEIPTETTVHPNQTPEETEPAKIKNEINENLTQNLINASSIEMQEEITLQEIEEKCAVESLQYSATFYSQQKAKNTLVTALKDNTKKIISINGKSGVGKNLVLRFAISELKQYHYVWLLGKCTPITQSSPFGLFQDILLTFFNINNFCVNTQTLKKNTVKFFKQDFPSLTNEEIFDLLNFLYPENTDIYENIYNNREKTFTMIKKVIETITQKMQTVIVIDKFENIDSMSYEFLMRILNDEAIMNNVKLLLTYQETRPAMGYLQHNSIPEEAYIDISIGTLKKEQIFALINQTPELRLSEELKEKINELSTGVPAIAEQIIALIKDYKRLHKEIELPQTFDGIMKKRLELLNLENTSLCKLLLMYAMLGCKFCPAMVEGFDGVTENSLQIASERLVQLKYIVPISSTTYEFKSSDVWKATLENAKNDISAKTTTQKIYEILLNYRLSSSSILAMFAQNLEKNEEAIQLWNNCIKTAAYIGDANLYIAAQKQVLSLIDLVHPANSEYIKKNIYTRLGKILEKNNPEEAFEFLPKAIAMAEGNVFEEIELLGYMTSCVKKIGNYYGVVECVDETIKKIPENMPLEIAMIKTRKLEALLNLGNCGLIINMIDNEIMPVLEQALSQHKSTNNLHLENVYETWIKVHLIMAEALVIQGDNRAFNILNSIFEIVEKYNITDELLLCKTQLAYALAYTIKGDAQKSNSILNDIIKQYRIRVMNDETISRWNLIDILNKFLLKECEGIHEELFKTASFANNINDEFTKNILKTLLGKVFKDSNSAKKALEIYTEQISHFAKEKIATGVLLGWYLASEAKLIESGANEALDIAIKALDVAQSPNICNYFFTCLLNKIIGEIYLSMQDYDSAKVYIEKALLIANKFGLLDQVAKLYLLYGRCHQDMALAEGNDKIKFLISARTLYGKSKEIAEELNNPSLIKLAEKANTTLNGFCKMNGIILK